MKLEIEMEFRKDILPVKLTKITMLIIFSQSGRVDGEWKVYSYSFSGQDLT